MSKAKRAVAVALLLVVAGCSGGMQADPGMTNTTTPEDLPTASSSSTSTAHPSMRETTLLTTAFSPSNPWQTDSVVVSVTHQNRSTPPTRYVNVVRSATTYWNDHYTTYSPFQQLQFVVRPNATNADIRVSITESITHCNGTTTERIIGCGELYNPGDIAQTPTLVKIEAGYTTAFTTTLVRHEFGHLLGVKHGDEPMPLMSTTIEPVPLNESNASERSPPELSSSARSQQRI